MIPNPTLAECSFRASNLRCIHFFRIFGGIRSSAWSAMTSPSLSPSGGSGGRGSDGGLLISPDDGACDDTMRLLIEFLDNLPEDNMIR